jgi:hypothetical protein
MKMNSRSRKANFMVGNTATQSARFSTGKGIQGVIIAFRIFRVIIFTGAGGRSFIVGTEASSQ